jgi:hypothetical protein
MRVSLMWLRRHEPRRTGPFSLIQGLKRKWLRHLALPAEEVRLMNSEVIFCAAGVLSATPLMYFLRRAGRHYVVFCVGKPEDADAFAERFGGEVGDERRCTLNTTGRPERVIGRTQGAERQLM